MNTYITFALCIFLMAWGAPLTQAAEDHDHAEHSTAETPPEDGHDQEEQHHEGGEKGHGEDSDGHGHAEETAGDQATIDPAMAEKVGIETAMAGPGIIERQVQVYGRLVTPPGQTATVRARFPGVVTTLSANVGDRVTQGEVLATIESNESLRTYQLKAPISGVVQRRSANPGEFIDGDALYELINTERLWAELAVFPKQRESVQVGQKVYVSHGPHSHEGEISAITPTPGGEPFVHARVVLDNADRHGAPGDLISADVVVERTEVPLVVANSAIQELEARPVVFVQTGEDVYQGLPLIAGRTDGRQTEVLGGVEEGDRYVVKNSYLIKADIEKSGASHAH